MLRPFALRPRANGTFVLRDDERLAASPVASTSGSGRCYREVLRGKRHAVRDEPADHHLNRDHAVGELCVADCQRQGLALEISFTLQSHYVTQRHFETFVITL